MYLYIYICFNQRTQCLRAFNGTFVCVKMEEQSSVSPCLCALSAISSPQIFTPNCGRTPVSQSSWAHVGCECSPLCGTTSVEIPALLKWVAKLGQESLLPVPGTHGHLADSPRTLPLHRAPPVRLMPVSQELCLGAFSHLGMRLLLPQPELPLGWFPSPVSAPRTWLEGAGLKLSGHSQAASSSDCFFLLTPCLLTAAWRSLWQVCHPQPHQDEPFLAKSGDHQPPSPTFPVLQHKVQHPTA